MTTRPALSLLLFFLCLHHGSAAAGDDFPARRVDGPENPRGRIQARIADTAFRDPR